MTDERRRGIAAKHLHAARCPGCKNGRYSGEHKPLRDVDFQLADALLAELDAGEAR